MNEVNETLTPMFIGDIKPNYSIQFSNKDGVAGRLNFNGPTMTFTGDAEESARLFFIWMATSFAGRLKEERERCAKVCDDLMGDETMRHLGAWEIGTNDCADAIRALDKDI